MPAVVQLLSAPRSAIQNGNALPCMWQSCQVADRGGSEALSRLGALGGADAGPGAANKSLLMLLALGRLSSGVAEMPWSVAEVALADLIGRFGQDTREAEAGAARVFTGLVADQVWVLDTDVPAEGVRPRALNAWRVAGRLAPDLEQALRSRPELIGEMARGLATRSFAPWQAEDVLEAVGLLDARGARPSDPLTRTIPADRARHRRGAGTLDDYLKLSVSPGRIALAWCHLRRVRRCHPPRTADALHPHLPRAPLCRAGRRDRARPAA